MTKSSIGKILIVDDEVELKNILVEALAAQGYEAAGFTCGEDALKSLRGEAFDVLLTDLMMPGMDGVGLVKESLGIDPHLIAIMMTGQGTIQTAVDAMKVGAFDYVLKPFRLQTMMPVLTRAMNARHLRLENLQLRETVAIYELAQTIAFTLDPKTVISKLADAALQQTEGDEVSVLLPVGDDSDELYVAAVRGEHREKLLGERVPLDESISGWVARQREPLMLDGEVNDARFRSLWPHPEITSAISIPMQVAGKLVGTININALDRARPFTLGQLKGLTILASTAAAALESASLYSQVQKAEANYRSIFENSIEGVFQANHDGRFLNANPAMARILGYDSPRDLIDSITNIDRQVFVNADKCAEIISQVQTDGSAQNLEVEAYRKDGEKIWLSMNVRAGNNKEGEPFCEGTIEDITARKRTEEELKQSEEKYRTILESIADSYYEIDLNGNLTFFNSALVRLLGYSPEELMGMNNRQYADPEHAKRGFKALREMYKTTAEVAELDWEIIRKDGTRRYVEASVTLRRDASGEIVGFRGVARDVTERRRAADELRKLSLIIEHSRDLIGIASAEGRVTFLNPAGRRIVGLETETEEAVRETSLLDYAAEGERERAQNEILPTLSRDGYWEGETLFRNFKTGASIPMLQHAFLISQSHTSAAPIIATICRDNTDRKRAEQVIADLARFPSENPSPILRVADDGRLLYANVAAKAILDEWQTCEGERVPDNCLVEIRRAAADVYGRPWEIVVGDRTFSFVVTAVAESDYLNMYGRDVTEAKSVEKALRGSEERYRDLVENAQDIIYSHDLQGNYTSSNQAGEKITGYSKEEALKLNFTQTIAPEYLDQAREMVARKIAGEEITAYELELIAKDGHRVPVEVNTRLVVENGVPVGIHGIARDITERKRSEQKLQASEQRFRNLVETTSDWIWEVDENVAYTYVSPRIRELLGYEPDEVLGKAPFDLMPPDDSPRVREMLTPIIAERKPFRALENKNRHKDGHLVILETSGVPIFDDTGAFCGYRGIDRDVTERKQTEEALRISEARYRALVDSNVIGVYVASPKGIIKDANDKFLEMIGYTRAELEASQTGWQTLTPPGWEKTDEHIVEQALASGFCAPVDKEFLHKNGSRVAVTVTVAIMEGDDGDAITLVEDITERKQKEKEILRLAAVVEETADSVVITDKDGNIQYVNPSFMRTTGYAKEDVLNHTPRILQSGKTDPAVYEQLWNTVTGGGVWKGDLTNRRKDGTFFQERVTISPIYDQSNQIVNFVAVKQDITDLLQLEDQLRQSQKMEAIGQLAGGVAHDFNNLLTAINGYSSLALQRLDDSSSIKPYLEEVKKAGDRAANLTRQLLAFGRKQILQPVPLDLNNIVTDMNKMLRRLIGEDIELTAKLDPELKKIKADPGQVEQVLVNLVVNARDAMPQGGSLTIETANMELDETYARTHVGVTPGHYVMLAVSDTGTGMNEETMARIFDPFFTTKEKDKGTGLGLSTVYGIVQQSGGSIWVYSELDRGTTFKVYLPQLASEVGLAAAKDSKVDQIVRGSETILLVEDEDVVRGLAINILESAGYKVLSSAGPDAVEVYEQARGRIHLLLTDVVMPHTSGKEIADKLKKLRPRLKVLYMSGYTDEAIVHHGVLDENVEFIQKPFTPAALSRKVREVLDSNGRLDKT